MTLQWTFVAAVLYAEIFIVAILLLPLMSPKTWQKLFRSRIAQTIAANGKFYFQVAIAILVLLFAESIRATIKFSDPKEQEKHSHCQVAKADFQMKMFRAQRNMYIAGLALFLNLIISRLVRLMAKKAELMAKCEANIKQAQSAAAVSQQLMDEMSPTENSATEKKEETTEKVTKDDQEVVEKELSRTQAELEKTKEELYKSKLEFASMKKQAENSCREYDRLMQEHEQLQNKLSTKEGDGNKKGN